MNCIGIEHYFGNLKKDSIDPAVVSKAVKSLLEGDADISGFIEPDIPEYVIALITGVFDNLALFTAEHYHIKLDKVSVSLSTDSGPLFWLAFLSNIILLQMSRQFYNRLYRRRSFGGNLLSSVLTTMYSCSSSFFKNFHDTSNNVFHCSYHSVFYKTFI
jgi:hypothetical protein